MDGAAAAQGDCYLESDKEGEANAQTAGHSNIDVAPAGSGTEGQGYEHDDEARPRGSVLALQMCFEHGPLKRVLRMELSKLEDVCLGKPRFLDLFDVGWFESEELADFDFHFDVFGGFSEFGQSQQIRLERRAWSSATHRGVNQHLCIGEGKEPNSVDALAAIGMDLLARAVREC